jgi:hypothetical protein
LTVLTLLIRVKILLMQILQKQNETDRMCKKSVAFSFLYVYGVGEIA